MEPTSRNFYGADHSTWGGQEVMMSWEAIKKNANLNSFSIAAVRMATHRVASRVRL